MNGSAESLEAQQRMIDPDESPVALLERAYAGEVDAPVLFVAAHPDDETIGAAALIASVREPVILHVTDGAPRDRNFVSVHFEGTIDAYAAVRAREARAALALAGVEADSVRTASFPDLEAAFHLEALTERIAEEIRAIAPVLIVTHAYEGGHPDHDAAAFGVHAASALLGDRAPRVAEMALYHAREDRFVGGEFAYDDPASPAEVMTIELDATQRALKQRMFDCFETQRDVLAQFTIVSERFRAARCYDFTMPPQPGRLWYEVLGWPLTGEMWRRCAADALQQLGLAERECL